MPWHIETNNPECSGYAVVKDDDGEIEGCHRTRREAMAQLAALNIAESTRAQADRSIIVDIDGTLLEGDTVIESVASFIRRSFDDNFIAVVTARYGTRREETVASLRAADIPYDRLIMRNDETMSGPRHKEEAARRLMESHDVRLAIDNDEAARAAYERAGVPRVVAPGSVRSQSTEIEERREGFTPNDAMVAEARRGLSWREVYGRGGTLVGVARARDIVNRRALSYDTVVRMRSYFARHEVDKQGEGYRQGESGYPSAGRIAWALWGGDAGRAWANRIVEQEAARD
jgi:hypothetical protein